MKTYSAYKESGIDWFGQIPAHWEIKKLKYLLSNKKNSLKTGPFGSQLKNNDLVQNGPLKVYTQRNVIDQDFDKGDDFISEEKFKKLKEFEVYSGDILFTTRGTIGKATLVPENIQKGVLHPCLIKVRFNDKRVLNDWILSYANGSSLFLENVQLESNSTIIEVIYSGTLKEVAIPLPPLEEQKLIQQYLNKKTDQIDQIIQQKGILLEKLQAKRQAIINEAVIKGVNPNVPMKPSGVEWLGEIPAHWEVKRLKYVLDFFDHKRIPLSGEDRGGMEKKLYDYYGASGIIDKVDGYLFDGEYILVGEDGANLLSRSTPLAFKACGKFWVNNHAHILKPKVGNIDYYQNLLETFDYTIYVTGSAQPKLTIRNLANIELPTPPTEEQNEISRYIFQTGNKIRELEILLKKQIDKLMQYRQSLISEVVTGKIKVV